MKKVSLLLAIVFLLQGCYSYKKVAIDPKTMAIGQTYKIERQNKTIKAVYSQNADSAIVVLKDGHEERIAVKDITSVRQQKFSLLKTAAWYPITLITLVVILLYGGA